MHSSLSSKQRSHRLVEGPAGSGSRQARRTALALAAAAALGPLAAMPASAASCTWNTTSGNWAAIVNWTACATGNGNPAGAPGAADTATIGAAGVVTVNSAQSIATLNNAGSLSVDASNLRATGGVNGSGTTTILNSGLLNLENTQTVGGNASIVFGAGANNRVGIDGGNKVVTFAAGTTVRGLSGSIGLGQFINGNGNSIVNQGLISSDSGGTINITQASLKNQSFVQAVGAGSVLRLDSTVDNTGGTLRSGGGGVVLQNGVSVTGGTISNTTGGLYQLSSSGSNFLSGVTLTAGSVIDMASATSTARVNSGMTLNGTVNVNNSSLINFEGDQTLGGSGSIVFGPLGNNRVGIDGGSKTLTVASGITIRGQNGSIGLGQFVNGNGNSLVNNGIISADVAGGVITLQGLTAGVTNNGTIRALNGGTLQLQSDLIGTPGGQLVAGPGSVILQQGVTISGVINTSGGGNLRPNASGTNFLSGVTLNGSLDMATAIATERVVNNLALNGTINIDNSSLLNMEGTQTLTGNGSIVFGSTGNNRVGVDGGNKTLTVANGVTIRGQTGSIGLGQLVNGSGNVLVNQGLISSDSGGLINIAESTLVNQSFAEAVGASSVLRLDSTVDNTAGTLRSSGGGVVLQNGVTVTGGNISNTTGGLYRLLGSGGNFLSGVTLTAGSTIDMASAATTGRVINGMVLNGTLNLDSTSLLNMEGTQTLSGTGAVVFGAGSSNRLGVDGGGKTLTIASGVTVRGTNGTIGLGQLVNGNGNGIVNNGTINSDGGGTITIQGLDAGIANNGRLRAQSGILNVFTALSGTGTLQVDAAGTMNLAAGAKTQGVLTMGTAGAALNLNTGNLTLSGDYTNAAWGSANSFNRRAGITGTGQILAGGNAAMNITGTGVTGGATGNATLTVGNVRVGGTTFNYQLANVGITGPTLRGAIQTSVNGGNLTDGRLSGAGVAPSLFSAGAPGANSGNLGITFTAGVAGALAPLTGQVLNLRSNFENIPDQKLNIVLGAGAAAYNAAVGSATPTPVAFAAQRVGGALSTVLTVANTASPGAFSEDLNASFSGAIGGATGSGGVSGRLAGTNNTGTGSLSVGLDTSTSGAKAGSVTVAYATAGAVAGVSNGLGVAPAGTQTINVSGNVYAPAVVQLNTTTVNFGTVRVGDAVTPRTVSVSNGASGALTDTLRATLAGGAAPFSPAGTATGIAAGFSNNSSLTVGLNTGAAGVFNSNGTVTFTSQNPEMADLGLGTANVGLQATVNNIAAPLLAKTSGSGSFSGAGTRYTLNFGTLLQGAGTLNSLLSLANAASGPADALAGSFVLSALAGTPFSALNGFGSFSGVAGGSSLAGGLSLGFDTSTLGNFTSSITLNPRSTNASQADLTLGAITLTLQGSVAPIPEPGTWALWLAGLAVLGGLARRKTTRRA